MKKLLITVCSVALLTGVGCTHKPSKYNEENAYVPTASFGDLENKVSDRVFFEFNSSDLSDNAKSILNRQVEFMKENPKLNFSLQGYCDKRGTSDYNLALGERRANSVKEYLVSKGIDSSRLKVISFGKEYPAVIGDSEEAYSQNRRTVTVII
jgi:peptidoglycan-associated lipoprotein